MTESPPTSGESSEKLYKIRVPTHRVVSYHHLEEGMELAREVTTRNGQLLYRAGTELDARKIQKLRRFNVKSVTIHDEEERWVDEPEYEQCSGRATLLETAESTPGEASVTDSESRSPEPAQGERNQESGPGESRKPRGETGSDQDLFSLFDRLQNTQSAESLLEILGSIDVAKEQGDDLEDALSDLREKGEELAGQIEYLLAQVANHDNRDQRLEILNDLLGFGRASRSIDQIPDLPDELANDLHRVLEQRNEVKNQLLDLVNEHGEDLDLSVGSHSSAAGTRTDPEPEERDLHRSTRELLNILSAAGIDLRETLQSDLADLLQTGRSPEATSAPEEQPPGPLLEALQELHDTTDTFADLGDRAREFLERLTTSSGKSEPANPSRALSESLRLFEENQWQEGIDKLEGHFGGSPPLDHHREELQKLEETKQTLTEQVEESIDHEPTAEQLLESLDSGGLRLENLDNLDIPAEVLDELERFFSDRTETLFRFWEDFRESLPEMMEDVDPEDQASLVEQFTEATDELVALSAPEKSKTYYESSSSGSSPGEKRQERIREAIARGDVSGIKENSALPDSIITEILHLYERPTDVNKWQNKLHRAFEPMFKQLVFGLTVPEEQADQLYRQTLDILDRETKPFTLFSQPDHGERYLLAHAVNTTVLSLLIGRELELAEPVLKNLMFAASLADVGMSVIPESLFLKEGTLTNRGRSEMAKHPLYSRKIATQIFGGEHPVTRMVGEHHERLDAEGYPRSLEAEEQHEVTPILAGADVYTAMVEERTYRGALASDQALEELREQGGFSRRIVEIIESRIGPYPNGSLVLLLDGRIALVKDQTPQPYQPEVLVLTDDQRQKLDHPERLDLRSTEGGVNSVLRN